MYDLDPRKHPEARLISEGLAGDPELERMASGGGIGAWGRGGMVTKVRAAAVAARSGAATLIAWGRAPGIPLQHPAWRGGRYPDPPGAGAVACAPWLAGQLQARGQLVVDEGAARVLRESGRSLLPVGVVEVRGDFDRGELVSCVDEQGREVARGLVNYSADEARRIMRQPGEQIKELLGYEDEPELVHRDNLVLI